MSFKLLLIFIILLFTSMLLPSSAKAQDSPSNNKAASGNNTVEQIKKQFIEHCLRSKPNLQEALQAASTLREDGSWADVNYNSNQLATWPTGAHITHIFVMTMALNAPNLPEADAKSLEVAIHKSLAYWIKHDYKCKNWYYNEIGGPQRLGTIALVLRDKLTPEEYNYITGKVLPRSKIGMTGQNRVWLAGNTLMNGLLLNDYSKVKKAASVISAEVVVTTREGIQPDFSFHQHGPQQQFGNYGQAFADEQLKWATILQGTDVALTAKKLDIMRNYLMQGLQWVTWRGTMDISSCGRQLFMNSQQGKGKAVSGRIAALKSIDPSHSSEYAASLKRNQPGAANDLIGTRYFWRSDYLINRRKDFCFTLKMCSKRVIGTESINSENLSGYHLADGAMYLYQTGDEFNNMLAVWDWRKIPGITCAQKDDPMPSFRSYRLGTDFVGGAEDGTNACAVLDYHRDGVYAKKAWFFIGDQAICLGSGIKSDKEITAPNATTINQCRLVGDVRVTTDKKSEIVPTGSRILENITSVDHDGMRYTFLQPQRITLSNQPQTGNWSKVQKTDSTPKADVTENVFCLYINHGANPQSDTYAYSILPIKNGESKPEVLSNTEKLQAVTSGRITSAIFYTPGAIEYLKGNTIEVDSPCALILNNSGKDPIITISDPTHLLKSMNITINGAKQSIKLPTGGRSGKSFIFTGEAK